MFDLCFAFMFDIYPMTLSALIGSIRLNLPNKRNEFRNNFDGKLKKIGNNLLLLFKISFNFIYLLNRFISDK